ncbi:MAG: hypothetical protein KF716_28880 [Anaerolineae bacterium]|nr:hypothetical protein [Anaerolineae bacterium]
MTAAPEDSAQRDLVTQLAVPIGEKQTREQARRVEAIQTQITHLDIRTADRLYQRLTSQSDALGNLFHLTLHHVTRASLISLLNAKRHGFHRGTDPISRMTDNRDNHDSTPTKKTTKDSTSTDIWPHFTPPKDTDAHEVPIPVRPPGDRLVPPPKGGHDSWVWSTLTAAASGLGMVFSVGVNSLSSAAIEKALEAAWIVFQTTEGPETMVFGLALEAAAEAVAIEMLGGEAHQVVNLNSIVDNFPFVDIMYPGGIPSVKARGLKLGLAASKSDSVMSAYTSEIIRSIRGGKSLDQMVDTLLANRRKLAKAWPTNLKYTTKKELIQYIRFDSPFMLPADDVAQLKEHLKTKLGTRLLKHERGLVEELLGRNFAGVHNIADAITSVDKKKLNQLIDRQIARIGSAGITKSDMRGLCEAARKYIPQVMDYKLRKKLAKELQKTLYIQ